MCVVCAYKRAGVVRRRPVFLRHLSSLHSWRFAFFFSDWFLADVIGCIGDLCSFHFPSPEFIPFWAFGLLWLPERSCYKTISDKYSPTSVILWKSSEGSGGSNSLPILRWAKDGDLPSLLSWLFDNAMLSPQHGRRVAFWKTLWNYPVSPSGHDGDIENF